MLSSQKYEPSVVSRLARIIVGKADGVFLWARLAMQDLVTGIWRRNSSQELEKRLEYLDNTLDGLFGQLLARIHPVDQVSAANYLKFQAHAYEDWTITEFAFGCDPELALSLESLVVESDDNINMKERLYLCMQGLEDLAVELSTRCAGLLDVNLYGDKLSKTGLLFVSPHLRDNVTPKLDPVSSLSPYKIFYHFQVSQSSSLQS